MKFDFILPILSLFLVYIAMLGSITPDFYLAIFGFLFLLAWVIEKTFFKPLHMGLILLIGLIIIFLETAVIGIILESQQYREGYVAMAGFIYFGIGSAAFLLITLLLKVIKKAMGKK